MFCEYCNSKHDGSFGSGRFCCNKCSRGYSTKAKRSEINAKVKSALSGRSLSNSHIQNLKLAWMPSENRGRHKTPTEEMLVEDSQYSTQSVKSRLISENIKKYECEICFISEYNNLPIVLQLHHKNGKNRDHRLSNLQILCPNCHSQTDNFAGRNRNKIVP